MYSVYHTHIPLDTEFGQNHEQSNTVVRPIAIYKSSATKDYYILKSSEERNILIFRRIT